MIGRLLWWVFARAFGAFDVDPGMLEDMLRVIDEEGERLARAMAAERGERPETH